MKHLWCKTVFGLSVSFRSLLEQEVLRIGRVSVATRWFVQVQLGRP